MSTAIDPAPPPATEDTLAELARLMDAGRDLARLRMILALAAGPSNVTTLCRLLGDVPQTSMSYHLKQLRFAGVVRPTRRGRNSDYALTPTGARFQAALAAYLTGEGGAS